MVGKFDLDYVPLVILRAEVRGRGKLRTSEANSWSYLAGLARKV